MAEAKESRDNNGETVPIDDTQKTPLGSPILWKNIYRQGPIVGVPIPWDLTDGDAIALRRIRVEGKLRASEVELKIAMALVNTSDNKLKVKFAMPIMYEKLDSSVSPQMEEMEQKGVNIVMDEQRNDLIERNRISSYRAAVDEEKLDYELIKEAHPQGNAPSVSCIKEVRSWMVFPVDFKINEERVVEVKVILPYSQNITLENGKETIHPAKLKVLLESAKVWQNRLEWGSLALDTQEMSVRDVKINNPPGMQSWKKNEGWYEWSLDSAILGNKSLMELTLFPEVKIEKSSPNVVKVNAGARSGMSYDQYEAKASSVLEGTDPNQLKTNHGGWAEGVSGDGVNEWVELTLNSPKSLSGILLVNGRSPAYLGTEEQKHPDLTFSFHGYAKKINVTLNGSYTFPVTVREDWNTQFIIPPYYTKPVKTIRITYDTVQGGKASDNTWISQILPVVK